jgi:DNA-binding transcriptional LysR family regulator
MVDDFDSQLEAIRHGLGIGYAPAHLVQEDVATSRLVTKAVADAPRMHLAVAWRTGRAGRGLEWLLERLRHHEVRADLVSRPA